MLTTVGALAGGTLLLMLAGRLGWLATPRTARPMSSAVMLAAMAGLAVGIRQLNRARDRRFDGFGLIALATMLSAGLSFVLFVVMLGLIWLGGSWLD